VETGDTIRSERLITVDGTSTTVDLLNLLIRQHESAKSYRRFDRDRDRSNRVGGPG
jgi:hypothetical protein